MKLIEFIGIQFLSVLYSLFLFTSTDGLQFSGNWTPVESYFLQLVVSTVAVSFIYLWTKGIIYAWKERA